MIILNQEIKTNIDVKEYFLKNSAEILNTLEFSADQILVEDPKGRVLYVNRACEQHYGLLQQEMIGKKTAESFDWSPLIHYQILETKQRLTRIQKSPNGMEILTTGTPVLDNNNHVKYIIYNVRDINLLEQNFRTAMKYSLHQVFQETEILNKKLAAQKPGLHHPR